MTEEKILLLPREIAIDFDGMIKEAVRCGLHMRQR